MKKRKTRSPSRKRPAGTALPKSGASPPTASAKGAAPDRRAVLGRLRNGCIAAAVVLGGGYLTVSSVMARRAEHDLSKIGNGIPAVVQVHDPSCALCRTLQGQARGAMERFDGERLNYLIADLNSIDGRALANEHLVGKTTLLLFDGRGELRHVMRGVQSEDVLSRAFTHHLRVPELPG